MALNGALKDQMDRQGGTGMHKDSNVCFESFLGWNLIIESKLCNIIREITSKCTIE